MLTTSAMRFGFGDVMPGGSGVDVELAQRALITLGWTLAITGRYDQATSAAVLEFRGAAGLPYVDRIDDAFLDRLFAEVDAAGDTSGLPTGGMTGGRTGDINISGSKGAGMALGLLGLLAIGYLATRKKKR